MRQIIDNPQIRDGRQRRCRQWMMALAGAAVLVSTGLVQAQGRVLVVHSYHDSFDWTHDLNRAIESVLTKAGVDFRVFFMDTKRNPGEQWKVTAGKRAMAIANAYTPDVIIAADDNAQSYFVNRYPSRIPVIFCGVNADPEQYGYPTDRITGILERTYADQVLQMLRLILPDIKQVGYISDDSPTADSVLKRVRSRSEAGRMPLTIKTFVQAGTVSRWQTAIEAYNADEEIGALVIPLYHTVKFDGTDRSETPSEVMRWTSDHTRKPIVGFWPFSTDDGALCAVVVDPLEHGRVAALMAKQVLAGWSISRLPMVTNKDGFVIVNLRTAARLGIDVPFDVLQSADRIIE